MQLNLCYYTLCEHIDLGPSLVPRVITTRGVSHCGLAIYIKKHLKAKEDLWKLKNFNMQKIFSSKKNPLKETKILQDIIITL